LVSGNTEAHEALETALAQWLGTEAALLFTSGYAANLGALACLVRPGDRVLSDALNHASIIDGLRLARASVEIYPHLDADAVGRLLAAAPDVPTWVVTESYFSMDADVPNLRRLSDLSANAGASFYVDETHALGVFGPQGRGLCADAGAQPDVLVGTFGKAFGLGGAFVAGSATLRSWLWNRARSFVFSTGLSPALAAEASVRLPRIAKADAERHHVHRMADLLRDGLRAMGCHVGGTGPVVPWVMDAPERALRWAQALRGRGFFVQAIRPPTVPRGTSRLRLAVQATHTEDEIRGFLKAVHDLREHDGLTV
jgi:8-amino-7-oxononanoate synthase